MMRQSCSRNQRSKGGFRLKLVLQIFLLLAICTWLLYQVKHSHDKKRAFENNMSKITTKVTSKQPDLFDFSRKSLPIIKQDDSLRDTRTKDDEIEDEQEEEQGELDHGMKQEEAKDEELKRGDEEEKGQEEEFFSDEEKDGQVDEDDLFDNKEVEDSAQEAREENYKKDDASSAVAHDSIMEIEDSKVNDLATAVNGSVEDSAKINNETLGYVDPISNVSNGLFGENITLTNTVLSINWRHSSGVSNQSEPKHTNTTTASLLEENDVSDNNSLTNQNSSKFNHSASNRQISQHGSSGLIPVQDQNYKADAR